jgi:hypothetical protein
MFPGEVMPMFSDAVLPDLPTAQLEEVVKAFPHAQALLRVDTTVSGYYQGLTVPEGTFHRDRAAVFLAALRRHIDDLFPPGTSSGVIDQLVRWPLVSTAEHMASVTNPESLNVVINQALYRRQRNQAHVLALPITAIKVDNILLSRDLLIGDHKLRLLPAKYRDTLVAEVPPIDYSFVERNLNAIVANGDRHVRARAPELLDWWERAYRAISPLDSFWKQLVVLNHSYWKDMIEANALDLPDSYVTAPMCVLVRDVMIEELQAGRGGWFYDILFDPARLDAVYRTFDGVRSCWDSQSGSGTFLFWAVNRKGEPRAMTYEAGKLVSGGGVSQLPMTPDNVLDALKSRSIYPGTFLVLAYLSFYLGLQMFGGILYAVYYPEMRQRVIAGNPLGLPADDVETIRSLRPDLYLNFERRELSDGGLLKLWYPQSADVYHEYLNRPFRGEIMGCLAYLLGLTQKGR